jgi:ATP-binding cassette, subfamily B, bacterial
VDQPAFSRVWALLSYCRTAKWVGQLAGVATAVLYVVLILVLALFVDLMDTRGHVTPFTLLNPDGKKDHRADWLNLSPAERLAAVRGIGLTDLEAVPEKPDALTGDEAAKWKGVQIFVDADLAPPLPLMPSMSLKPDSDEFQKWTVKRKITDPALALAVANSEQEVLWQAHVWHILKKRVGDAAAERHKAALSGESRLGILGLVARHHHAPAGRILGFFASVAPWTWNGEDANRRYLTGLLIFGLVLVVVRGIFIVVMNETSSRATLEVVTRLRRAIYHQTARRGSAANPDSSEESGAVFVRDVDRVHDAVYYRLTHRWRNITLGVLLIAVALATNFWLSMTYILFALLVWSIVGQLATSLKRQSKLATRVANNRLQLLIESLQQIRLVKAFIMELFNQSRVERQLADYSKAYLLRSRGDSFAKPLLIALGGMAAITLLYLSGRVVLSDGMHLAGAALLAVAFLSLYLPVRSHLHSRRIMKHGRDGAAAIYDYLDRRSDVAMYPDAEFLQGIQRGIEFADVSVSDESGPVLDKVDFKIKVGQRVGLVGPSDREKHAVVSLLARFIDPSHGFVKIDNRDVKWLTQDSLRTQIGLVMQSGAVFNDTVAHNIGCGDPNFNLPQIIEAAKIAHAHQFIVRLPYGYETPIGELGHRLTPGQQFRIALARAILRDPSMYVIEEPSDAFDDDSKDLVDDTFSRIFEGKTILFLPHRVSTLRTCDKILLLHEGKIVTEGDHRELIKENELYRHLYYLEYNPFADQVAVG